MKRLKRYLSPERLSSARPLDIQVQLHNDVTIVYPPQEPSEIEEPQDRADDVDGCVFSGNVSITHEPFLQINNVRLGVVVMSSFDLPKGGTGEIHQDGLIFERYQTLLESEMETRLSEDTRYVVRKIVFAMVLPSTIPTWESLPGIEILPQLRIVAEYGYNSSSLTTTLSRERGEKPGLPIRKEVLSNLPDMIMEKWTGDGHVAHPKCTRIPCQDHDASG
jgi:hypothetical protein